MHRRWNLVVLLFLLCLMIPLHAVSADAGPKPTLKIRISYEGQPVLDPEAQARLLVCLEDSVPSGQDTPLPGLDRLDLRDPSGCVWQEPEYFVYGGTLRDGQCTFSGGLPTRFRLAVYLPEQNRTYLTDVAERSAMHERYVADLAADGTGRLSSDAPPLIGGNWTLIGMLVALALTLAIELVIILIYARITETPRRRILIVGAVANAVTLPGVWLLAGLAYALGGLEAGLIALAIAEGLAWILESVIYLVAGKLKFGPAVLLSLAANVASLLIGLVVH